MCRAGAGIATEAAGPRRAVSVSFSADTPVQLVQLVQDAGELHVLHVLHKAKRRFHCFARVKSRVTCPPPSGWDSVPASVPSASIAASRVCASSAVRVTRAR